MLKQIIIYWHKALYDDNWWCAMFWMHCARSRCAALWRAADEASNAGCWRTRGWRRPAWVVRLVTTVVAWGRLNAGSEVLSDGGVPSGAWFVSNLRMTKVRWGKRCRQWFVRFIIIFHAITYNTGGYEYFDAIKIAMFVSKGTTFKTKLINNNYQIIKILTYRDKIWIS